MGVIDFKRCIFLLILHMTIIIMNKIDFDQSFHDDLFKMCDNIFT